MPTVEDTCSRVNLSHRINCVIGKRARADKSRCGVAMPLEKLLDPPTCETVHRKTLREFNCAVRSDKDVDLYMQALTPLDYQHRVKLDDAEADPGNYCAYAMSLDLDFYSADGTQREKGKRYGPKYFDLERFTVQAPLLKDGARIVCRTKNGIRILFVFSHTLTPHEYVTLYSNVCNEMLESYPQLADHKRGIDVYGAGLVLDMQTCVSLTRIPYGIRDKRSVVESWYFAEYARKRVRLDVQRYGPITPASSLHKVATPRGYRSAPILKRPIPPNEEAIVAPPFARAHWSAFEAPGAGERDNELFKLVCNTIYEYRDNLSSEQYFKILKPRALEIPGDKDEWIAPLWEKICRQYIVRLEAEGETAKLHDLKQQQISGERPFYAGSDYDVAVEPLEALEYVEDQLKPEIHAAIIERALAEQHSFLNLPPGAGKSSMVPDLVDELVENGKKCLVLCPDNAHVERYLTLIPDAVPIYSYGYLIDRLFAAEFPDIHEWMQKAHQRYTRNLHEVFNRKEEEISPRFQETYFFDSRFEDFFIPQTLMPRPFSQYLTMRTRRELRQYVERRVWRALDPKTRARYDEAMALDPPDEDVPAAERREFARKRKYMYIVREQVKNDTTALIRTQHFASTKLPNFYHGKRNEARELAMKLCSVNLLTLRHSGFMRRAKKADKLVMTRDKLPFILEHALTGAWMEEIDVVIHDEADGSYFFDREILESTGSVGVYRHTDYKVHQLFSERVLKAGQIMHDFFIDRPNILVNADRGIELVLARHGFGRIKVFGADAPKIYDDDLSLVFHPAVSAKRIQRRNVDAIDSLDDIQPYVPFMAAILDTVPARFFKIADGLDYKTQPLRGVPCETNTVRATGSNAMIDSEIASTVGYPHPTAVAAQVMLTGETPETAIERIFENRINQIVGRNTGYRAQDIVKIHPLYIEQPNAHNKHVCFLPEGVRGMNLDLKVVTENIYTPESAAVPREFSHIFAPGPDLYPVEVYIRFRLDKLPPGTLVDYNEFVSRCARELKLPVGQIKRACKTIHDNPHYRDYVFKQKGGKPRIYIRNDGYGVALRFFCVKMEHYVEYVALTEVIDLVRFEIQRTDEPGRFIRKELVELCEKAGHTIGYILLPERRWIDGKLQKCFVSSRNLFDKFSR